MGAGGTEVEKTDTSALVHMQIIIHAERLYFSGKENTKQKKQIWGNMGTII